MSLVMNWMLSLPLWMRAAFGIIVFWGIWCLLGKVVLWFLSVFPWIIRLLFQGIWSVVLTGISALHGKMGGDFYRISNQLAKYGEKTDRILGGWYESWHRPKGRAQIKTALVCGICYLIIIFPAMFGIRNSLLRIGETVYLKGEEVLFAGLERIGVYDPMKTPAYYQAKIEEEKKALEGKEKQIMLVVTGVKSALSVRDVPSVSEGKILESVENGTALKWTGKLVFVESEDGQASPWVQVITENGTEGWSSLAYLQPEEYQELEFQAKRN